MWSYAIYILRNGFDYWLGTDHSTLHLVNMVGSHRPAVHQRKYLGLVAQPGRLGSYTASHIGTSSAFASAIYLCCRHMRSVMVSTLDRNLARTDHDN